MGASAAAWSMTGFGQGSALLASGACIDVQIRTVNHRHADVRCKVCPELSDHTARVEERVRKRVLRGRAEVGVRLTGGNVAPVQLDTGRAREAYQQLLALRDELDPGQPVPLSLLSSVPGLFGAAEPAEQSGLEQALAEAIDAAVESLNAMRQREGRQLVDDLRSRLGLIATHVAWLETQRPALLAALRERLRGRVQTLLDDAGTRLDAARLEQEIALLAERSDVAEEITRLHSHMAQFGELLGQDGEPVGRKLDFLLQEMNREVNTIGSKGSDAQVAQRVVELKAELERLREQVQNVL